MEHILLKSCGYAVVKAGMVKQIRSETLSERAYVAIRDSILRNELLPNTPVFVDSLAHDLGISPTPVREALAKLTADGLVYHEPRKGMRVAELTEGDVREAYAVRRLLEPHVARLAAEQVRRGDEALQDALERLAIIARQVQREAASTKGFYPALFESYTKIDLGLHDLLLGAVENSLLQSVFKLVGNHSLRIRSFVEASFKRSGHNAVFAMNDEHLALLEALLDGRADDAERLTKDHLVRAEERTLEVLRELKEQAAIAEELNPR